MNRNDTRTTFTLPRTLSIRFILTTLMATALVTLFAAALANSAGTAGGRLETPPLALAIHLFTVIPAVPLGIYIFLRPKGTTGHKRAGRVWVALMVITAIDSFWIRSSNGGIGPIHIFSCITLISVARALFAIKRGDMLAHEQAMTGCFIGLLVAGLFSFMPGRILGTLVFG